MRANAHTLTPAAVATAPPRSCRHHPPPPPPPSPPRRTHYREFPVPSPPLAPPPPLGGAGQATGDEGTGSRGRQAAGAATTARRTPSSALSRPTASAPTVPAAASPSSSRRRSSTCPSPHTHRGDTLLGIGQYLGRITAAAGPGRVPKAEPRAPLLLDAVTVRQSGQRGFRVTFCRRHGPRRRLRRPAALGSRPPAARTQLRPAGCHGAAVTRPVH